MSAPLLRNSERSSFKRCRHSWQWGYKDGRQPIAAGAALRFGDLYHQALAAYYLPGLKRGPHPAVTFEKLYHKSAAELKEQGFNVFADETWVDALTLGVSMLSGYVAKFAAEDDEYEILSTERTFRVPIRALDPYTGEPFRFVAVGTLDGVWKQRSTGRISFKEHKTCSAINLSGLPLDDQAGMYWTYGPKWLQRRGILKEGELPSAILYTFHRKAAPNPDANYNAEGHKLNKDGSVSKVQPAAYWARVPVYRDRVDRERIHARIVAEMADIIRARAGLLPLYKNPGPLYMPNCSSCSFKDACELHEVGGDWESVLEQTHIPWDPYADHELAERV